MSVGLKTNIQELGGIGPARAKLFAKCGIFTIHDLITYFPRAYEDRRQETTIHLAEPGTFVCIRAMVTSVPKVAHIRKGLDIIKVRVSDAVASMEITFFNKTYVKDALREGETYVFYGKIEGDGRRREMKDPVFEREDAEGVFTRRIIPVYRLTAGLSGNMVAKAVQSGLDSCMEETTDPLPDEIRERYSLCHLGFALKNIHFPDEFFALDLAQRRFAFEELFFLSVGLCMLRDRREEQRGICFQKNDLRPFYASLPFSLTSAQQRVIGEIQSDLLSKRPMNRLVQGDVGSGKTAVAAAAIFLAAKSGFQSAMMAPTEILAEQHFRSLAPLLEQSGIQSVLLTGSMRAKEKKLAREKIASGEAGVVIGTHALLSEEVQFHNLGLVVADEQHRFGVQQRSLLTEKGEHPHVLVMSATPIPRTLALIIYGDLELSVLDELPPGRQKVDTFVIGEDKRERMFGFIRKLVGEGRQAYIVCPLIEENEESERKALLRYAQKLSDEVFPDLTVGVVHGRMKGKEKETVMSSFARGEIDILVSTTVIEVGVDVPNAAVMVVENAELFGLSQLHQLRGRVGRGQHKSYCILVSDAKGEESRTRLSVMRKTNDGFVIAEEDLKLRGPGDFFGNRQHGLPDLKIADLTADLTLLQTAQRAARELLEEDPHLALPKHQNLKQSVQALFTEKNGAMN